MSGNELKFLLLHPKGMLDPEVEKWSGAFSTALVAVAGGKPFRIVTGREDAEENLSRLGGWPEWQNSLFALEGGKPRYRAFLVSLYEGGKVGKVTAELITAASATLVPVFSLRDGELAQVQRCNYAGGAWRDGWEIELMPKTRSEEWV
jgi:hypothetical protein